MTVTASPNVHAAEQLLQSLPNPSKVREIWLDISYFGPQGSHAQAVIIVGIIAVTIVAVAIVIAVASAVKGS